jgi:transposase-like protein
MELKKVRQQKRKFTEIEILNLLEEYKRCSTTTIDFCRKHGIVEGTFYAWKKKYQSKAQTADNTTGFVPLTISSPAQRENFEESVLFAEVIMENGKSIRLFRQVPSKYLKELIG